MRIIQISDTHLSIEHRYFAQNNEAIAARVTAEAPDLVVHTGDLCMDGAALKGDLGLAAKWNAGLGPEVLAVPGNHDVGDHPAINARQPLNSDRLSAWRNIIGPDRWAREAGGWRLIGINAMLLGTGHPQEEAQFTWLAEVLHENLPCAIFLHKPLFIDHREEGPRGYWTVNPEPRARLLQLLDAAPTRLVATGHLHIHRQQAEANVAHVWGPAASFVVGSSQEELGGVRHLGLIEHTFTADRVTSRFIRPDGLTDLRIDPVQHIIYPPADAEAPR